MKALFLVFLLFFLQMEISGNIQVGLPVTTTTTTIISGVESAGEQPLLIPAVAAAIVTVILCAMKIKKK